MAPQALQFMIIIKNFNKKAHYVDILSIVSLSSLFNFILPFSGGTALRGVLLKKLYDISWSTVTSILGTYYVSSYLAMAGLLVISGALVFSIGQISLSTFIVIISFFMMLSLFVGLFLNVDLANGRKWVPNFMKSTLTSINSLKKNYTGHINNMLLQILIVVVMSFKLYLSFVVLGFDVSYYKVFLIQSFVVVSLVFSLTPGNIGIKEGIIVFFAPFLGLTIEETMFCTLLDRVTNLLGLLFLGILSKIWLIRK